MASSISSRSLSPSPAAERFKQLAVATGCRLGAVQGNILNASGYVLLCASPMNDRVRCWIDFQEASEFLLAPAKMGGPWLGSVEVAAGTPFGAPPIGDTLLGTIQQPLCVQKLRACTKINTF